VSTDAKPADLVLEGGGVLGIAHVGAVSVFLEHGYRFERVAGTSAGAVVGSLIAAGMPRDRLRPVMDELKYRDLLDRTNLAKVPIVGTPAAVLFKAGVCKGDRLREWLGKLLNDLDVETFEQLKLPPDPRDGLEDYQRYKLVVITADVTSGRIAHLPWDYQRLYGLDPDKQRVVDAVRASMSIPYLFEPFKLRHATGTSRFVDGGVLSAFPIDAFDRRDGKQPRWPTFGVKLIPPLPKADTKLLPWVRLLHRVPAAHLFEQIAATMIVGHDQTYLDQPWVAKRAIQVDTDALNMFDFGIEKPARDFLYDHGRSAATGFLDTWDWVSYRDEYRAGPPA